MTEIPAGLCQCGCGQPTSVAKSNYPNRGVKKGEHFRFLRGHGKSPHDLRERLAHYTQVYYGKCWGWTGSKTALGYPVLRVNKKNVYAHRLSYEYTYGEIPTGLVVMHTCDNPSCTNPEHLVLGTKKDNTRDMVSKDRWKNQYRK